MPREMRYRTVGILFYLVIVLSLAVTQNEKEVLIISDLFTNSENGKLWVAVFTAGVTVFTSDAVGFVMSALFYSCWQRRGGYSRLWEKKAGYNPKDFILTEYRKESLQVPDKADVHKKFEEQWESYSSDAFLNYVWYGKDTPKVLEEWVTRRFTLFFAYWSSIVGIALGFLVSFPLIHFNGDVDFTEWHVVIVLVALGLIGVFAFNAGRTKREAWQMIDLWIARSLNPRLRTILNDIREDSAVLDRKDLEDSAQGKTTFWSMLLSKLFRFGKAKQIDSR